MNYNFNLSNINLEYDCSGTNLYKPECLNRYFCPQLNKYFVGMGLVIVIGYIIISWLLWWFFNDGYKFTVYKSDSRLYRCIGNLHELETRLYWDAWIRIKLAKLMLGYIVVVIWFNV